LSNEELIPVTWIKLFHYCPRIIYFLGVLGVGERLTESMIEGFEGHAVEEMREGKRLTLGGDRRTRVRRRWASLYIASERLGLKGIVDMVVDIDGELAVVEVKRSEPLGDKPKRDHLYQAVAYAMLAEEKLGRPVRRIILRYLPSGKVYDMPVTEGMRRHIRWTINQINRILREEKIPPPPSRPGGRCQACGWLWICRKV